LQAKGVEIKCLKIEPSHIYCLQGHNPIEMILNMAKMAIGKKDRTNEFLKKVA
jgi:hypothetical protein